MNYDVIVLGGGGMGSAAAAHLAGRGRSVLVLEQFTAAHDRGSSHGDSRIIRQAYFEHPAYVPLLQRAYELWEDLDQEAPGILTVTGGLMLGRAESAVVTGSLRSARVHALPHELLDAADIRRRFPAFTPDEDTVALFEQRAGYVRPELTVRTHLERAARAGAELRFQERALSWTASPSGEGVVVQTDRGRHEAGTLVVSGGAWNPTLLADLGVPLAVERQLLFWFRPTSDVAALRGPGHPVFIWEEPDGSQLYGFPALGTADDGVKVAFFRGGPPADPDDLDRVIHDGEIAVMRAALERRLPTVAGPFLRGLACMYTNTPDEHFVIGLHPRHPQVVVAAGFSGHGFKFVPVVGEILADLATTGSTAHDIRLFAPTRFSVDAGDQGADPVDELGRVTP